MDSQTKIQLLLLLGFCVVLLGSFMVILHTIGNIQHLMNRLEEILTKETILRLELTEKEITRKEEQDKIESERKRRSEALLRVPIVSDDKEN